MANTKILGTKAVVKVGGSAGTDGTAITLVKAANFSIENNPVDVTDNDSSGAWNEFLMGNRTGTFDFTCNWDSDIQDPGQDDFLDEISAASPTYQWVAYYPEGTGSGNRVYSFKALTKSVTHNAANEAVVELSVSLQISGAITIAVV